MTRLARRPATRVMLALLSAVVLLTVLAPLLPLPHYARLDPARGGTGPAPVWRSDASSLDELRRDEPRAAAVRELLFGRAELAGALGTDALGRDVLARVAWAAASRSWSA